MIENNEQIKYPDGCHLNETCKGCNSQPAFICENAIARLLHDKRKISYLPRELATALVKELDDHWLVMHEVNKEPMITAFMEIISDHTYIWRE